MVRYNAALFLAHNAVLLLLTNKNHLNCLKQILLGNSVSAVLNRIDGSLVHHIGKVRTNSAGSCKGNFLKVYSLI